MLINKLRKYISQFVKIPFRHLIFEIIILLKLNAMRKITIFFAIIALFHSFANAQTEEYPPQTEKVNLGIGAGFDYGGVGINMLFYPQKNIGLFAGGGYALAGVGYNIGLKGRFFLKDDAAVTPFVMGMYGYHSAVKIKDNSNLSKLFYGPTFGAGIDWRVGELRKNYIAIALTVPLRNGEEKEYKQMLTNNYGAQFENDFLPVGMSIGYRLRLK